MIEFYSEIRLAHIAAVLASGAIFFLRGIALFAGAPWPTAAPCRYLGYTIDTVLLTAGLMLTSIVQQYPFVNAWLTVKVVLLVIYIGLGFLAFRANDARPRRIVYWIAALAIYAFIISVAQAHDPLGILRHTSAVFATRLAV